MPGCRPWRCVAGALVALTAAACTSGPTRVALPSLTVAAWQTGGAGLGPGVFVNAVTPAAGGEPWVAVGSTEGPDGQVAAACFESADARQWAPCRLVLAPDDLDGAHTRLLAVTRLGATVIAGGVAVGALHGNLRPTLWRAQPGGALTQLPLPRELFGGLRIITFGGLGAGSLGGFAAGTWDGVTRQPVAQVWRTGDGADWMRLDGVAALTSPPDQLFRGAAVAVGRHRVVMVGATTALNRPTDRDNGAAWWSDDGRQWHLADTSGAGMTGPGDQELRQVVAAGGGFLAGGSDGAGGSGATAASMWWSPDGRRWVRAEPLPAAAGPGATITSLVFAAGRSWAAGVVGGRPRLWSSGDGRFWVGEPLPAPTSLQSVRTVALAATGSRLLIITQSSQGSTGAVIALTAR